MTAKQRIIQFKLMLTPEEKATWVELAEQAGLDISELVRRRMASCRIQTVPEANWQCYWQLLKIGTNINQIAKAQNTAVADGTIPPPSTPSLLSNGSSGFTVLMYNKLQNIKDESTTDRTT